IMSEGLLEIERFAFAGSTIETLVLPSTVRNICIYSFRDCSNLKSVYSKITDPSVAYPGSVEDMEDDYEFDMRKFQTPFGDLNNADDSTTPRDIPLYVPSGSLNDYKTTPGWLWFDGTMAEATEFPE
ncbi:MAG: leucine-rich repeat domain-containing protein, partial [Muribaculaceae bacterium]|nr:leucine-rich repeat domain-containing protein [Muribaculaceae bacterium]